MFSPLEVDNLLINHSFDWSKLADINQYSENYFDDCMDDAYEWQKKIIGLSYLDCD